MLVKMEVRKQADTSQKPLTLSMVSVSHLITPAMARTLTEAHEVKSCMKRRKDGACRKWMASLFSTRRREEMIM
jgi:hypothetical protein